MRVHLPLSAHVLPLIASVTLLSACSNEQETAAVPPAEPVPVTTGDPQIDAARRAVAADAGVEVARVVIKEARVVEWASRALGCPEPGMNYAMVLTPGVFILLELDGTLYRYHGTRGGEPFPCPDDRAEPPAAGMAIM